MPSARLFLLVHFLDKIEDVELFDLAVRIVAADRVLLVVEDLEDGGELRHDEELDITAVEVDELYVTAGFAEGGGAHHERAEAGAIDEIRFRELQHHVLFALGGKLRDLFAQGGGLRTDRDAAVEFEDGDALPFALLDVER